MPVSVFYQPVGEELGGSFHQGISFIFEECFVLRELVMFPQMAA